jgi:hypothetical protein
MLLRFRARHSVSFHTFMSFPTYWPATCYNIHQCFNDQARSAYWNELNYDLGFHMLGFFDDINCKGESILTGGGYAPGVPNFGHMRVRVSSFATITFGSRIEQYAYFDCSGQSGQTLEPILISKSVAGADSTLAG